METVKEEDEEGDDEDEDDDAVGFRPKRAW
jgi:hypothetical protein